MDLVLRNKEIPYGGYEYNAFVQLDGGIADYREILMQGWALYYLDDVGDTKKYTICEYNGRNRDFKLLPHGGSYHSEWSLPITASWENIVSVLISTRYFTVVPVHQTNLAIQRFPV
jgi:hypothetical protein